MCLLVLAWEAHPRFRLVVAANRDEFHARPSGALDLWAPEPIAAGRDLQAGGTWLGIDAARRFGVVTNFRELARPRPAAPSRGELIPRFLRGTDSAERCIAGLAARSAEYAGFNLLLGDSHSLWYATNRSLPFARCLPAGIHGLSNELLDTPWPKLRRARAGFEAWLRDVPPSEFEHSALAAPLFDVLADRARTACDSELPRTGLAVEWERLLSSVFVTDQRYGTRCSTVLLLERSGALYIEERRFDPAGESSGRTQFTAPPGGWIDAT